MTKDVPNAPVTKWWMRLGATPGMIGALILTLFLARFVWQWVSPYTLVEDEAHYWEWARRIDWSYYSKGPGVAWSIWLSTRILGDTEFAVRLPSLIASACAMIAMTRLAHIAFADRLTGFVSALLWLCVPGFAIAGLLMTIDSPYVACWAWACVFASSAVLRDRPKSWIGFGLMIALGFIFKYTILLIVPGALLALLLGSRTKKQITWFALGLCFALPGLVPVLIWNAQHDWATVRHLLGHLGMSGGDTANTEAFTHKDPWTILWFLEYLVLQFAIAGAPLILALLALINVKRFHHTDHARPILVLSAFALPIYAFYLLVSLKTQTEGNWAMAGAVSLIPIAAWGVIEGVKRADHTIRFFWGASIVTGIACLLLFPLAPWASKRDHVGHFIPIHRFTGLREHSADAQAILTELQSQTSLTPFILTEHYGRASQLAFYLPDHPTTYCTSAIVGGRKTQYDIWTQTNPTNPDTITHLLGRPALLMGGRRDQWGFMFQRVVEIGQLESEPVDNRTSYVGYGFLGFEGWEPGLRPNNVTDLADDDTRSALQIVRDLGENDQ